MWFARRLRRSGCSRIRGWSRDCEAKSWKISWARPRGPPVATKKKAKTAEANPEASRGGRRARKADKAPAAPSASAPAQTERFDAKRLKVTQIRSGIGFDKK